MKLNGWHSWSITTRLVMIAVVPALMTFVAVSLTLYFSSKEEIKSDVEVRGQLIAGALAESSRYAVISGNTAELERVLNGLLSVANGIASISITSSEHKTIISVGTPSNLLKDDVVQFEHPIQAEELNIDLFDDINSPHLPAGVENKPIFGRSYAVGYVQVTMTPATLFKAKRQRVYISISIVFLVTLASFLIGLTLAQRLRQPINVIVGALRAIHQGKYDINLNIGTKGELGEMQDTVVEMAKNLKSARQNLEAQVEKRTTELQEALNHIREADAERRRLIARGNHMVEEERRRIAIEVHDSLNATLISVRLWAADIASKANAGESLVEIEAIAQRISATTNDLYSSARNIVKQLRPEILDMLGLRGAVEEMVRHYDQVHQECHFTLKVNDSFPKLYGQLAITAYRIIQEALSNIVKHSGATRATVTLDRGLSNNYLLITISDNGRGFDTQTKPSAGIGLIGMRERVTSVGGTISIDSGDGVKISIQLPVTVTNDNVTNFP